MEDVARLALLGGECSGKTTLAHTLSDELPAIYVPEALRAFVDERGRTPAAGEQLAIMNTQIRAESQARVTAQERGLRWIVADPGVLMTAVYSIAYFGDESLLPSAIEYQAGYDLTIWCDIDLPWQPDGTQRDGPEHRARVHEILLRVINSSGLSVLKVSGPLPQRLSRIRLQMHR